MNKTLQRLACTLLTAILLLPSAATFAQVQPEEQQQGPVFNPDDAPRAPGVAPFSAPKASQRRHPSTKAAANAQLAREDSLSGNNFIDASLDPDDEVGELTINDMPVNDVLDLLQKVTGKSVLRQSTITGTFSFHSQEKLTRAQTVNALVSMLAMNGVAVTRMGNRYLKAVPGNTAVNSAPTIIENSTLDYEPSQEVCSKIFHIDFLSVPEAVTALTAMQSGLMGTSITPFEKNRSVLATDSLVNLQRMERILAKVDKPSDTNQKLIFFPLHNVTAREAQTRCQQLVTGQLAARFTGNTTVDADDRTNQLIVYTHEANEKLIRDLVANLDKDVDPMTRTQMFSIRHADATELCTVIKEVITGQEQVRDSTSTSSSKASNAARTAEAQQRHAAQTQTAQTIVDNAGTQFSNYITIVPDERSNMIVATGTPSDIRLLTDLISQLDAVLPQVRIEVIIAEVTLNKGQNSGLDSFGVRYGSTAPSGALSGDVTSGNGLNNGNKDVWLSPTSYAGSSGTSPFTITPTALENFSMDAVFNVAKTNSNVQVLSAPNIVTTHNREASIIVGSREPIVSGYDTYSDSSSSSSSSDNRVATISYEDIALELTVKPLIGSNGVIQMEITQKVNEVTSRVTIAGYGSQPVIGTRQASSFVSVADGKMVVLGGLQKNKTTKVHNKVYILGDIPLLGRLFQPKEDSTVRTELLIFIRPVILSNPDMADADARKKIAEIEPAQKIQNYMDKGNFRKAEKKDAKKSKNKGN